MNAATPTKLPASLVWQTLQLLGMLSTIALLAGLVFSPESSLRLLWFAIIPVLPATFLIHPALWRNVCPLATLNMVPGRFSRNIKLSADGARWATAIGVVLLAALVPARRFVFNTNGAALAAVIAVVALLALALGLLFERKAGFCNVICPVLPVERLYGQGPLIDVTNPRCPTCTLCTTRGCLDLVPRRSAQQAVANRAERSWLFTTYGAFAAAFPGFVVGYYLGIDCTWAEAHRIYGQIGAAGAASWAAVALVTLPLKISARLAFPLLGALALGLYYWFGAPGVADAWGLGDGFVLAVRGVALALVGLTLARQLRDAPRGKGTRSGGGGRASDR